MWGSEVIACGWLERGIEESNITTALEACYNHEVCRRDLSQGMRFAQTCATTQFEQTLMVAIEAPPFSGLRANYNILKEHDDGRIDIVDGRGLVSNEQWTTWQSTWRGWRKSAYSEVARQPGVILAHPLLLRRHKREKP